LTHTIPTPLDSLYIWAGLYLFTLEYGGQAVYMETHPYPSASAISMKLSNVKGQYPMVTLSWFDF
jgi:hypothetical protein